MRLLWVVQRYGPDIVGGAEAEARQYARRLAQRGHEVSVLTSCAVDYVTWKDELAPGDSVEDGVEIERLAVAHQRSNRFWELDRRLKDRAMRNLEFERSWLLEQGPVLQGFAEVIDRRARQVDVVVFTSYLYHPTVVGLPIARRHTSTALTPTAHREAPFELSVVVPPMLLSDGLIYNSVEEQSLVTERLGRCIDGEVVGMGVDDQGKPDPSAFRRRFGLGDDPYLLYVGRIDYGKGVPRLLGFFDLLKRRRGGALRLVLVGSSALEVPDRDDVVVTGFVSEELKAAALTGAVALVQPSRMESFSIVAIESWSASTPVLCDARSDVVVGHAMRSGGGIPFADYLEFEAAVEILLDDPVAASRIGAAGRAYVDTEYRWPAVIGRLERGLEQARDLGVKRLAEQRP